MRELRCPSCNESNAVPAETALDDVRCAACHGVLDETEEVRYFVAAGKTVRGPLPHSELRRQVAEGTLHREVRLSEEGGPWVRAGERADLFPTRARDGARRRSMSPGRAARRLTRAADRRPRRKRVPPSVAVMAGLNYLLALAIFIGGLILASLVGPGGSILILACVIPIGLGLGLARGAPVARVMQLLLAGLAGLGLLPISSDVGVRGVLLLVWLLVALPFPLLLNSDANAFFRQR